MPMTNLIHLWAGSDLEVKLCFLKSCYRDVIHFLPNGQDDFGNSLVELQAHWKATAAALFSFNKLEFHFYAFKEGHDGIRSKSVKEYRQNPAGSGFPQMKMHWRAECVRSKDTASCSFCSEPFPPPQCPGGFDEESTKGTKGTTATNSRKYWTPPI